MAADLKLPHVVFISTSNMRCKRHIQCIQFENIDLNHPWTATFSRILFVTNVIPQVYFAWSATNDGPSHCLNKRDRVLYMQPGCLPCA